MKNKRDEVPTEILKDAGEAFVRQFWREWNDAPHYERPDIMARVLKPHIKRDEELKFFSILINDYLEDLAVYMNNKKVEESQRRE